MGTRSGGAGWWDDDEAAVAATFPAFGAAHDAAVQATNADAQGTKLSAVERGYYDDDFLRFFAGAVDGHAGAAAPSQGPCSSSARKPPLINHGTFTRVFAVRDTLRRFLQRAAPLLLRSEHGGGGGDDEQRVAVQVISLGAGTDTLYLNLLRERRLRRGADRYVELDFPELAARKAALLERVGELRSVLTDGERWELGAPRAADAAAAGGAATVLRCGGYALVGVDLRDSRRVLAVLREQLQLDPRAPTMLLAECVLVYLPAADGDALLRALAAAFRRLTAFSFDPVRPFDAFGRRMVKNVTARGSPLLGIAAYPTAAALAGRYRALGWRASEAMSMLEYHQRCLPVEEKRRVSRLEALDELEEFHMLMEHYALVWAASAPAEGEEPGGEDMSDLGAINAGGIEDRLCAKIPLSTRVQARSHP